MARGSAGATLVVMTDDLDHGHRATSRLYRLEPLALVILAPVSSHSSQATARESFDGAGPGQVRSALPSSRLNLQEPVA
jgi:hypothetical protein